jgi:glycerol-3-phosphate dehydrogenase (NAD(P)+)
MSQKDTQISVLGDGGWGTTLSLMLARKGLRVRLWGYFPEYIDEMRRRRENVKFLPGFRIPHNVELTSSLKEAAAAPVIVIAVPAQHVRAVLERLKKEKVAGKLFVIVSKGIETRSLKTLSQVVRETLGAVKVAVLSGPNIAREVAEGVPSAAVVASKDPKSAAKVRGLFSTDSFKVFESSDVLGVELGGSLKNVIAIGAGMAEGMGFGTNTRAVFFARGLAEMAAVGIKMGAKRETFMGLSGLGDLATTALNAKSRNHWFGCEIGKGRTPAQVLKKTEMVVEGVETARSAYRLARKHRVDMPVSCMIYQILFEKKDPRRILDALWKGGPRRETD